MLFTHIIVFIIAEQTDLIIQLKCNNAFRKHSEYCIRGKMIFFQYFMHDKFFRAEALY